MSESPVHKYKDLDSTIIALAAAVIAGINAPAPAEDDLGTCRAVQSLMRIIYLLDNKRQMLETAIPVEVRHSGWVEGAVTIHGYGNAKPGKYYLIERLDDE